MKKYVFLSVVVFCLVVLSKNVRASDFLFNSQVSFSTSTPTQILSSATNRNQSTQPYETGTYIYIINNSGSDVIIKTSPNISDYSCSITTGTARIPTGSSVSLPNWWGNLYGLSCGSSAANVGVVKF